MLALGPRWPEAGREVRAGRRGWSWERTREGGWSRGSWGRGQRMRADTRIHGTAMDCLVKRILRVAGDDSDFRAQNGLPQFVEFLHGSAFGRQVFDPHFAPIFVKSSIPCHIRNTKDPTMTATKISPRTIELVKATVPVLAEHGITIVATMYRNMFRDNPEVKPLFNQANQSSGEHKTRASQLESFRVQMFPRSTQPPAPGSQQLTLTHAVVAYAANIDNPAVLLPAIMRIAHKHASIDIRPDQYAIVGKHLLGAIKEVLGDAATPEIMAAWAEAYAVLADLFIDVENQLRHENASKIGGFTGFRTCRVVKKVAESDSVYSFYLVPKDGGPLPMYKAGQYVCFRLNIPGVGLVHRNYSLSAAPGSDEFRVSIKREPGARGFAAGVVSNHFHDDVHVGDEVDMAPPYGDFSLVSSDLPPVFIAAGIGITPMFSMFQHFRQAHPARPVHFIQCMRNGHLHPLKEEVDQVAGTDAHVVVHSIYSAPTDEDVEGVDYQTAGHFTLELLQSIVPDNEREFYFTGPIKFMRDVRVALHKWGVPSSRIHYECFGPHTNDIEEGLT